MGGMSGLRGLAGPGFESSSAYDGIEMVEVPYLPYGQVLIGAEAHIRSMEEQMGRMVEEASVEGFEGAGVQVRVGDQLLDGVISSATIEAFSLSLQVTVALPFDPEARLELAIERPEAL